MILTGLSFYGECLTSWWWLLLVGITVIYIIVSGLTDDDYTLSTMKAWQLACVGVITVIPWVNKLLPFKLEMDFKTRWAMLDLCPFISFLAMVALLSFFFALPLFIFAVGDRYYYRWRNRRVSVASGLNNSGKS